MDVNVIIGIFGMLLLLAGLLLLLAHNIKENSKAYLLLNIFGGAFLFYYSYSLNSVPFMILQGVWTVIPLYNLIFSKR